MITLGITTFNREDIAYKTTKSNLDRCGLDRSEYELIWLDDASTDNVRDTMAKLKPDISILNEENEGVSKSWNKIYKLFETDWLVKLPHDCELPDNWLKTLLEYIETFDADLFVFPLEGLVKNIKFEDIDGIMFAETPNKPFLMGACAINKRVFEEIGYLDEDYGWYGYDDVDFAVRFIMARLQGIYIKDIITKHIPYKDPQWYIDKKKEWVEKNAPLYLRKLQDIKDGKYLYVNNK